VLRLDGRSSEGVQVLRKSALLALLAASCVAAPPAEAAGQKHRPAGMPASGPSFRRQLQATFASERVIVAARQSPAAIGFADARDCPALYDAVAVAFGTGHLVVAAAGNDGRTRENFPASYPHVLTVAATNPNDETSGFSTRNLGIDLAAPGESIPAAVPLSVDPSGYLLVDGTSFSAPLVSAAAAWAWTSRASAIGDVTQLFELLRLSSRDIGAEGWDKESGFGVLDLPSLLSDSIPDGDPSEPNDDIDQVVAHGPSSRRRGRCLPAAGRAGR
jgi:hypothetical protein